ncbi:helix-turn-helix transcriptional regulator [Streptomyces decoyicus]|uniref:helix-turn-helix transcriptional regulator n=1 Tax=Streptomyces decoyicus TaxID=249567 RepID=UPI00364C0428
MNQSVECGGVRVVREHRDLPPGPGSWGFGLVGRDRELGALLGALRSQSAVVLVEGGAGIGKSRLVAEASALLQKEGVRVVTGGCHPLREALAFGPVIDALRRVEPWLPPRDDLSPSAGALAPLLPDLAGMLPEAPSFDEMEPGAQRFRVAHAVRTVLQAITPAVLVIEDLHWSDEATLELLLMLARDLPDDTGMVLTYRGEDLPEGRPVLGAAFRRPPGTGGAEIRLGPLAEDDVRSMAQSALGRTVATVTLARTLFERSGGLPLIAEEDLITLSGQHSTSPGLGRWPQCEALGVPRSLREVMEERLGRLSADAVAMVHAAAVLSVPASEQLLAEAAGLQFEAAGQALVEALEVSVLRETGPDCYDFSHGLGRQAVYEALPGPLRTEGHRRALRVLWTRASPPLVQIAHHTRALGDVRAWLTQAQEAADHAASVGDHGTAAALLRELLNEPTLLAEQHARAALNLARIAWDMADYSRTITTLRQILAGPGLPASARCEIRFNLGLMLVNHMSDPAGETEIEKAVPELEQYAPHLAARALSSLAMGDTSRFSAAEQRDLLDRAQRLLARTTDEEARTAVAVNRITVLANLADPEVPRLLESLPRQASPAVVRQTARALANVAETTLSTGLDDRSRRYAEEALALAQHSHSPSLIVNVHSYELLLSWLAGHWDGWDQRYAAFRAEYADEPLAVDSLLSTVRGITAAARAQVSRAAEYFDRVLTRDAAHTNINALGAAAGMARIHLTRGDSGTAWETVRGYLEMLPHKDEWVYAWDLVPVAVETALMRGDRAAAEDLTERHRIGIQDRDSPGAVAEQHLCQGLLLEQDDPDGAYGAFERASDQWQGIGRPYHMSLAEERAARVEGSRSPAAAAARLGRAIEVHNRLGATSDAARCQSLIRNLGMVRPSPRGRSGYGAELSPREQQVAVLLRDGATNREIAVALFLSIRTVEHHVARVLKKLRTSRTGLAEQANSDSSSLR